MKAEKKIALAVALIGLGLATAAQAVPIVNTAGSVFDPSSGPYTEGALSGYILNTGATPLNGTTYFTVADNAADAAIAQAFFESVVPLKNGNDPVPNFAGVFPYLELTYTDDGEDLAAPSIADTVGVMGVSTDLTSVPGGVTNFLNGIGFTLDVNQTIPVGSTNGSVTAAITGTVLVTGSNGSQTPNVQVVYSNPDFEIDPSGPGLGYLYHADNLMITSHPSGPPSTADVTLDVSVAPLPSVASTGFALLSCVGGLAALRRRVIS